jgi:hypothetical protein
MLESCRNGQIESYLTQIFTACNCRYITDHHHQHQQQQQPPPPPLVVIKRGNKNIFVSQFLGQEITELFSMTTWY